MPPRLYAHEGFEGHWSGSSERCCEEDQEYISKVEVESKLREIRELMYQHSCHYKETWQHYDKAIKLLDELLKENV